MDATFSIGDVVKLNSGGPIMTVSLIDETHAEAIYINEHDGSPIIVRCPILAFTVRGRKIRTQETDK